MLVLWDGVESINNFSFQFLRYLEVNVSQNVFGIHFQVSVVDKKWLTQAMPRDANFYRLFICGVKQSIIRDVNLLTFTIDSAIVMVYGNF